MDIETLILEHIEKNGEVKSSDIVSKTGFSRTYVNRFLKEFREKGVLILIGKANKSKYIPATQTNLSHAVDNITKSFKVLKNKNLNEDQILSNFKKETAVFKKLTSNVLNAVEYAFTEMVNNAIDHSMSEKIEIKLEKMPNHIIFEVRDKGVGIFNHIKHRKKLNSRMDAIQDLLKGRLTTLPSRHTGEGIFFTSKTGNLFIIQSSGKKLIFDNLLKDIFLSDVKPMKGTRIVFSINIDSDVNLNEIFNRYTDSAYKFSRTEIQVKLYEDNVHYVSRSQARRLLTGLEKFKHIVLDFKGMQTVGQAFSDEIFRVWQLKNPDSLVSYKNTNQNILFMIKRSLQDL